MENPQKEPAAQPPPQQKDEKQNLSEKQTSDIKNQRETQGEINLSRHSQFKGSLDKPSTLGEISLLKKLI